MSKRVKIVTRELPYEMWVCIFEFLPNKQAQRLLILNKDIYSIKAILKQEKKKRIPAEYEERFIHCYETKNLDALKMFDYPLENGYHEICSQCRLPFSCEDRIDIGFCHRCELKICHRCYPGPLRIPCVVCADYVNICDNCVNEYVDVIECCGDLYCLQHHKQHTLKCTNKTIES